MARKALRKQRNWIKKCREQVIAGLINDASGGWTRMDSSKAMHRDCYHGYKIGRSSKKRGPKTQIAVE